MEILDLFDNKKNKLNKTFIREHDFVDVWFVRDNIKIEDVTVQKKKWSK